MTDHRSMAERMAAGDWYLADDPELGRRNRRAMDLMDAYNATRVQQGELRAELLSDLLGEVGEDVEIRPPFYVDYGTNITVGPRTFANFNFTVLDIVEVRIGADCQFGPGVQLLTATHPLAPTPRREKWEAGEPITIGDNVWLGGGVIVNPGVTIGENTVVGSGSVVTKDLPANVIAVGAPARVLREFTAQERAERSPER